MYTDSTCIVLCEQWVALLLIVVCLFGLVGECTAREINLRAILGRESIEAEISEREYRDNPDIVSKPAPLCLYDFKHQTKLLVCNNLYSRIANCHIYSILFL